jgi:hypothetical protein
MTLSCPATTVATAGAGLLLAVTVTLAASLPLSAQAPQSGQNIAPVYEGFETNPDGSFNLLFGYYNRNWEEEINVPVGPDNSLEPGGPDRGAIRTGSAAGDRFRASTPEKGIDDFVQFSGHDVVAVLCGVDPVDEDVLIHIVRVAHVDHEVEF